MLIVEAQGNQVQFDVEKMIERINGMDIISDVQVA
jgi:hypothetical protein